MRLSVIISDMVFFFPAVWLFIKSPARIIDGAAVGLSNRDELFPSRQSKLIASLLLLLQPSLLMIDHGHFQYNGVCLGLSLASFAYLFQGRNGFSCTGYVLC